MLKLMKYEFRKQLMTKFLLLAVLGLLEVYFLYGVFADKTESTMRAVLLLSVLAFAGIFFVSFECIMTYNNDLRTKQSYMLFMVPESTFSVMGAKILSAMIQIILTSAVFGVMAFVDAFVVAARFDEIDQFFETIQMVLHQFFSLDINAGIIAINVAELVIGWISVVILAMLAITLSATFMANSKLRGVVSFVFFIVIEVLVTKIRGAIVDPLSGNTAHLVAILLSLVIAGLAYPAIVWMLKKKVSL
ncbi:MAG: hypothetical protein K2P87_00805 [Lachnospiraceae bacterium]|nr:hypothetical protein [Lachnospiraceae bacterium]